MYKEIFSLITEPLGLPINMFWEYIILAVEAFVAYAVSYKIIGLLYRKRVISGREQGKAAHWIVRLIIFVTLWAITYGVITLGRIIIDYPIISVLVFIGIILFVIMSIVIFKKFKNKQVIGDC